MITGFLTIVLWALIMNPIVNYLEKQSWKDSSWLKRIALSTMGAAPGCILALLYFEFWEVLAVGLAILFFLYLIIVGLFGL